MNSQLSHRLHLPHLPKATLAALIGLVLTIALAILVFSQAAAPAASEASLPVAIRPADSSQALDLGAGYQLKHGKVIAPPTNYHPASERSYTLDLGAGYVLKDDHIIAPATNYRPEPKKIDLKGGYWLVINADGSQTILH